jgi:hypothetical protein
VPLQGARRDAGIAQLLGGARGRGEPFDAVAGAFRFDADGRERRRLTGAGDTLERQDLVAAGEDPGDRLLGTVCTR